MTETHMLDTHLLSNVTLDNEPRESGPDDAGSGLTRTLDDVTRIDELWQELWAPDEGFEDEYVVFFRPPPIDDRIANQLAVFSFQSDPRLLLDRWLEDHLDCYRKIVIPGERKLEFRDKLDQMNVNHRTQFPDLKGLAT